MPRRKTTVYLDEPVLRAVKRVARERGSSEALVIRDAIASYVRSAPRQLPRFVGAWKDGPGDLSERVDQALAEGFGEPDGAAARHQRPRRPAR